MRSYGVLPLDLMGRLEALSPRARFAAMVLRGHQLSNMAGLYRLPVGYLAEDLGCSPDEAEESLVELEAAGEIQREKSWVWVIDMAAMELRVDRVSPRDNRLKSIHEVLAVAPSALAKQWAERYLEEPLVEGLPEGLGKGPPKPGSGSETGSGSEEDQDMFPAAGNEQEDPRCPRDEPTEAGYHETCPPVSTAPARAAEPRSLSRARCATAAERSTQSVNGEQPRDTRERTEPCRKTETTSPSRSPSSSPETTGRSSTPPSSPSAVDCKAAASVTASSSGSDCGASHPSLPGSPSSSPSSYMGERTEPCASPGTNGRSPSPGCSSNASARNAGTPKPDPMEGFDEFWKAYPKKVAKTESQAAWKATRKVRPPVEVLVKALKAQFATTERQYVTYPPKWLKGQRWNDEVAATGGTVSADVILAREDAWIREHLTPEEHDEQAN